MNALKVIAYIGNQRGVVTDSALSGRGIRAVSANYYAVTDAAFAKLKDAGFKVVAA